MDDYTVDGNALAGALEQYMGRDMTAERGTCGHCGSASVVAELVVYPKAPSPVARCPQCGDVVMVVTEIHGTIAVHLDGYQL
jgi:ribosomal protein S27AE